MKAVVTRDAKQEGVVVAPKGAVLTGRINRLERRRGSPDYYFVGLDFSEIEFAGKSGEFRAILQDSGVSQSAPPAAVGRGQMHTEPRWQSFGVEPSSADQKTGGAFVVMGSQVNLARGHSMTWRTVE